jgi:serine protease Do
VRRSQLGLVGETITPEMAEGLDLETDHGIVVSDLEPDGAAARAGIEQDDIVVALNGKRMASIHQLEANVYRLAPGTKVTVHIQRGAEQLDIPVVTEEESGNELDALADTVDPLKNLVPQLGIIGLDVTKPVLQLMPDLRRPAGVVVAARNTNVPYSGPPLETGDVIYSVNRKVVSSVAQLRQILSSMQSGQPAVLLIEREGRLLYVPMQLD